MRAAHCGLEVLVLEKSDKLGGTSAMSGAGIWIPANHLALAEDVEDTVDEGLAYINSTAPEGWGQTEDERWATFAHIAPRALEFIDQKTPLIFLMTNEPDPFTEAEGGKARGRQLTVAPLSRWRIGHLSRRLRRTTLVNLFNCHEMTSIAPYHRPFPAIWKLLPRLTWRLLTDSQGQGNALMTSLIRGYLDADVRIERNTAATNLVQDEEGRVTGVKTQVAGREMTLSGGKGVLIATRGFE